jgi:polyhydroxybutyrate depolymerase
VAARVISQNLAPAIAPDFVGREVPHSGSASDKWRFIATEIAKYGFSIIQVRDEASWTWQQFRRRPGSRHADAPVGCVHSLNVPDALGTWHRRTLQRILAKRCCGNIGMNCVAAHALLSIGMLLWPQLAVSADIDGTLTHDGKQRTFLLAVPEKVSLDDPLPLLIALHPYPNSGRGMADLSGFSAIAEREGFLVAYPNGIDGGYNAIMCCGGEDDVGFVNALIRKISADYKVDPSRIYATGISNGGDMSYRLAAELPGIFAAIGPVSGGMSDDWMGKASGALPEGPISLIAFHGKQDKYYELFRRSSDFWLAKQGCQPSTSMVENTNIELATAACAKGSAAAVYTLPDMGHAWPGGAGTSRLAYSTAPIKASELIWAFFRDHPKR